MTDTTSKVKVVSFQDHRRRKGGVGCFSTMKFIEETFCMFGVERKSVTDSSICSTKGWKITYNDKLVRLIFDGEKIYEEWCSILATEFGVKIDPKKGPIDLYNIIMACWLGYFTRDSKTGLIDFKEGIDDNEMASLLHRLDLYGIIIMPPHLI